MMYVVAFLLGVLAHAALVRWIQSAEDDGV